MRKLLLLTALLMPVTALAWTALAYSPEHGISYLYYMAKNAQEAEQEALAGCKRAASNCRLLGESRDGPLATMVVNAQNQVFRGSHADPRQALQQAMQDCQGATKGCRLVSAAWDRGTHVMAIAIDHENAWVGNSQPSEAQAKEAALTLCHEASRSPDKCTLFHVLNGPGWVAIARSAQAIGVGLSVRSPEIAVHHAQVECQSGKSVDVTDCKDIVTYHNSAGTPEPASFRELVTRIHADKRARTASVPPFLGRPSP